MSYNNASVIAVWGSPGSGKSTFSAILARYLTRDKSKAIIISPDQTVPMMPVWFPNENIENNNIPLDQKITISKNANSYGGSQVYLEEGGEYLLSDLLKSVTVASANDSSVALAEYFYGDEQTCVEQMNKKAQSLGLKNTLFAN